MQKGDRLFVYGTLRPGERMDLSNERIGGGIVKHEGRSRINGAIYNLGSYPGAAVEGGSFDPKDKSIIGDVFEIIDERAVAFLDTYEGYPYLYDRKETETEDGLTVWVYTYNNELPEQPIKSGDWQKR